MSGTIQLRGAGRTYVQGETRIEALRPTDLTVSKGELVAIVGRSGSGKSTLLNLLTGIDRPTAGTIDIDGTDLSSLSEGALAEFRGSRIGIVFQFFELIPTLTVIENVVLAMDLVGVIPSGERRSRALALLERLGVADQARKLPSRLSGGQQQRVAIARSLANDPPIVVADEPSGNLDSINSELVLQIFGELAVEGRTVIVATHDFSRLDRYGRILEVVDGNVTQSSADRRAA